ncbi:glucosaminidase domain-containing protein [Neobacillus jeddahensis]|uniref:glucosaminidase domain-containing protein n=1 Tax=Neobacillus jeddahensis TaxID=1461580 RepID=UPI000694D3BE|nr:glucosaminidase domain-containing protein [Neobacillus jeddahensis]
MINGDDWFTKTMLINTLSRTEKLRSQLVSNQNDSENLFANVLNQLLEGIGVQASSPTQTNSFSAINSTLSNSMPNLLEEMSYNSVGSSDSLRFQSITADQLNQKLNGKLTGMGHVFISAGKQYNIDPSLLAAVAQHETGNGKSRAAYEKNNVAGMMGINGLKSYSSVEDSISDMARNLSKNYLGKGLATIGEIGNKYAPIGASNDPTGLNNHWVTGVTKYYQQLQSNTLV